MYDGGTSISPTIGADENATPTIAAGESFCVTVTAEEQAGATTPNYGQETPAEGVLLTPTLIAAGGINNPAIVNSFTSFTSGVSTRADFNWPEVGIITLTPSVTDTDYLVTGDDVTGTVSANVGRFTPFDFDASLNTPVFGPACGTFSYLDQPFQYSTQAIITVTAREKAHATTQNYQGSFFKLTQGSLTIPAGTIVNTGYRIFGTYTLDTTNIPAKPTVNDTSNGTGTITFSLSGSGTTVVRGAPEAPFDAEISLEINIIDGDSMIYRDNAGVDQNPAKFADASAGFGISSGGNKEQRWGRLFIGTAVGSELLPLSVPFATEYYNGTVFIPNIDDVAPINGVPDLVLDNNIEVGETDGDIQICAAGGTSTFTLANPTLINGDGALSFSASRVTCTGYSGITLNLTTLGINYLLYDWDGDSNFDNNPSGRVDFGLYEGPDEFIYIREPW
ncbi:MAG: hypothetical protein O7D86_01375 [Proteobacteria bacterium]|nr:hypothetical protein [Pseudomonadota bacterium]